MNIDQKEHDEHAVSRPLKTYQVEIFIQSSTTVLVVAENEESARALALSGHGTVLDADEAREVAAVTEVNPC